MKNKGLYLILSLLLLAFGCKKEDDDVVDLGYDYFPITTGAFIEYNVVEIFYNDFDQSVDTVTYLLKEKVDSVLQCNADGSINYRLNRYKKENDTLNWIWFESWSILDHSKNGRISVSESDSVLVKMVFPFTRGKTWDGNAMNTNAPQLFQVTTFDLKEAVGDTTFRYTATINQRDNVNVIEDQRRNEKYARKIGLIYKHDVNLKKDVGGKVIKGTDHTWTYKQHGVE